MERYLGESKQNLDYKCWHSGYCHADGCTYGLEMDADVVS